MSRLCNQCECVNINGTRCHESGCPNQHEQIRLGDDGTMDTVFYCAGCSEEFRFTYMAENCTCEDDPAECEDCYDDFVYECLHELQEDHECEIEVDDDVSEYEFA